VAKIPSDDSGGGRTNRNGNQIEPRDYVRDGGDYISAAERRGKSVTRL
jgi:hypothetical protein